MLTLGSNVPDGYVVPYLTSTQEREREKERGKSEQYDHHSALLKNSALAGRYEQDTDTIVVTRQKVYAEPAHLILIEFVNCRNDGISAANSRMYGISANDSDLNYVID